VIRIGHRLDLSIFLRADDFLGLLGMCKIRNDLIGYSILGGATRLRKTKFKSALRRSEGKTLSLRFAG
jgi:hypothetical protein